jgi:hypothetical protein
MFVALHRALMIVWHVRTNSFLSIYLDPSKSNILKKYYSFFGNSSMQYNTLNNFYKNILKI